MRRRGFTLLEVSVVLVITAIIAVSFAPAIASLDSASSASAADFVAQRLTLARHASEASGTPTGVQINPDTETIEMLEIASAGAPQSRTAVLGDVTGAVDLLERFGIDIASFSGPDGSTLAGVIWFGHDGAPESRDSDGAYITDATADSVVVLGSPASWRITVHRGSGLITKESP